MDYFNTLVDTLFQLICIILLIPFTNNVVNFISKIVAFLKDKKEFNNDIIRWSSGVINLNDIHDLTPDEFEYWSGEFLFLLGYRDIKQSSDFLMDSKNKEIENNERADGGKDIICTLNNKIVYVECKRYINSPDAPRVVNNEICRKLVGCMTHDNVINGIVITTGFITEDAYNYVNNLPDKYNIRLINGNDLLNMYLQEHNSKKIS